MKIRLLSLSGMLVLSLLTSVTLAGNMDGADKYLDSEYGTVVSGVIKSQNNCPPGTAFFKNQAPNLSNNPNPGSTALTYTIDNTDITMNIEWSVDNSFQFSIENGVVHKLGAEVDSDKLIYEYGSPVSTDTGLNVLKVGGVSADVSHLDFCLAAGDTVPPTVTITKPSSSDQVSGEVTVEATVSDNVDLSEVTLSVNDEVLDVEPTINGDVYTWVWDATDLPAGEYTITVSATDTGTPVANTTTVSVTVELVDALDNCLGVIGDEDFDNPSADEFGGGCNPSGYATVQAAPDINPNCDPGTNEPCLIGGNLLTADPLSVASNGCDACGSVKSCGEGAFPDPRMEFVDGRWVPTDKRDLVVFQELGGAPDGAPDDALVLDEYTYGYQGCFGVVKHFKNFFLIEAYPAWPQNPKTGLVFVKTVFPEEDWEELPNRPVAKCYGPGNSDLQEAAELGYQTTDKALMVEGTAAPFTNLCGSGRTLTRNQSYEIFNVIETAGIDFGSETGPADVLAFKYQMASMKFDALFAVLANAQPTLLTGKFSRVSSPVNQAKAQFENGTVQGLDRAIGDLEDASDAIKARTTWQVTEENWPGDALGRIANLVWRLTLLKQELIELEG